MFRIWARKDAIDQVEYAKELGPKILRFFELYFDVPYPLPKQVKQICLSCTKCLSVRYSFISGSQNVVFGCLGKNYKLAQGFSNFICW
jgi:hypothetical protein